MKQKAAVNLMKEDRVFVEEAQKMKPRFYTYPNWNESQTVFDFEDLLEDALIILCVRANHGEPGHEHDQHKAFVWTGPDFDSEEAGQEVISVEEFTERVLEQYWGCKGAQSQFNIEIQNEFGEGSDDFNEYI